MKYGIYIAVLVLLASCKFEGVDVDDEIAGNDTNQTNAAVDTIDPNALKPDSLDGQVNEMVFQRDDGLRVEWDIKNDNKIELGDVVMVNYKARVAGGEQYDSNEEVGEPWPLKTSIGSLIQGWEEGMLMMHEGDKGRIMIPNALAYGENGYKTIVPPDADIIVDLEIVQKIKPIKLEDGVKVYKYKTVPGGSKPEKNQKITFDYFAFRSGKNPGLYDNSYQHEKPFSFKFENDNVVDGLHIGMSVMKAGESAFIEIPAKVAYGAGGLLDLVPKNTDIVYDVRVESIE